MRGRTLRVVATLVVTGLCTAYLLWKIDLDETARTVGDARLLPLVGSLAIMLVTLLPMAYRWQILLAARGIPDRLPWLLRAYLTSYAAGQVLPTSIGGDAMRIYESSRRHPGRMGDLAGSVLLERALGGIATLALAAAGFLLAIGHYDVGIYVWLELLFVLGSVLLAYLFFARSARGLLRRSVGALRRLRLERPLRALYIGIHAYRAHGRVLLAVFALTLALQTVRILAIYLAGVSAGVDLSPRAYYVMGPLLFLVMLVPFSINGLAVREAFFVSFLGTVGVAAEPAFATGFLFFVVTIGMAVPGAVILGWEGLRGAARAGVPDA